MNYMINKDLKICIKKLTGKQIFEKGLANQNDDDEEEEGEEEERIRLFKNKERYC